MEVLTIVGMLAMLAVPSAYATTSKLWDVMNTNGTQGGDDLEFEFWNYDSGSVYWDNGATYNPTNYGGTGKAPGAAEALGAFAGSGWDTLGILKLNSVLNLTKSEYVWNEASAHKVYGIFWGATDSNLSITAMDNDTWLYSIKGSGMQFALFEHYGGTPPAWLALADQGTAGFDYSGANGYSSTKPGFTGMTNSSWTPILSGTSGYDVSKGYEFAARYFIDFDPLTMNIKSFTGDSWFSATDPTAANGWGVGTDNALYSNLAPDFVFKFALEQNFKTTGARADWSAYSSDPANLTVTPELSSSALMLVGMLPIGIGWWRRRKA